MAEQPTDPDIPAPVEQFVKDIYSPQPSWLTDGYGIRGPQRPISTERATPARMDFVVDGGKKSFSEPGEGGEDCDPGEGADDTIKYIKATQWNGSAWECVWLPTCASTCDESP